MNKVKLMAIALLSILLFLTGCTKDEVVPMSEQSTAGEKVAETQNEKTANEKVETAETKEEAVTEEKQVTKDEVDKEVAVSIEQAEEETDNNSEAKTNTPAKVEEKTSTNTSKPSEPVKKETANQASNNTRQSTNTPPTTKPTEKQQTTSSTDKPASTANKQPAATPNKKPAAPTQKAEPKQTVTVSVVSDTGTVLSPIKVEMKEGQTVLDVTLAILKQKGIQISVTGSGSSAYVEGINNLYEFDKGPLSGWTVEKNGSKISRSSGAVQVKNGDAVQWIYTTDYVKDE